MRRVQEAADREDSKVPRGTSAEERGSEGQAQRFHAEGRALSVVIPIGYVRNSIRTSQDFSEVVSDIVIFDEFKEGLFRLDESKEIFVLFVFDRNISKGFRQILHPKGDDSIPVVGVFASRSPFRPNPIGMTRVELLSVKDNILTVKGLDAFEGTPVIDIKPVERRDGGR